MTCPFDLGHYRELVEAAKAGAYRFAFFDAAPQPGDVLLRHDVDLSLEAALAMAEVEAEEGVWATYFLMTRSIFYNLASTEGERAVVRLRELGHRVGHHAVWPHVDLDPRFDRVVAWHNPEPWFMETEVEGAVNVMRPPFFDPDHYRSDSNQHWRHGCPHAELLRGEFDWLQLLIHPVIWIYEGTTMRATMDAYLDAQRVSRVDDLRDDRIDMS